APDTAVLGLSDYGRCAFGSGKAASPAVSVAAIVPCAASKMCRSGPVTVPEASRWSVQPGHDEMGHMSTPPFRFRRLDHVVFCVRDVERMLDFYCRVVGCQPEKEQPEIGLWQLRAGDSLIDLVDVAGKLGRMGGAAPSEQGHNDDHV